MDRRTLAIYALAGMAVLAALSGTGDVQTRIAIYLAAILVLIGTSD